MFIVTFVACNKGEQPGVYRVSQGRAAKFEIQPGDDHLRIVTYLKLRNGTIQEPRVHYFQKHFTMLGTRSVEKPGGLWTSVFPQHQSIYLPVSKDIEQYLFLISRGMIKETQAEGQTTKAFHWTDWQILEVSSEEVVRNKQIAIPPFDEIVKKADENKELLEKLRVMYEKARADAEKKMNTPVKDKSEVPWYAR